MDDNDLENSIRVRAYLLWEQDGAPERRAEEYWHRASRLIASEQAANQASAPPIGEAETARDPGPDGTPAVPSSKRPRKSAGPASPSPAVAAAAEATATPGSEARRAAPQGKRPRRRTK